MFRNIVVPLDGSNFSLAALPFALAVAERSGGEIQLVVSVPTLPPVVPAPEREGPVRGWFEEERVRATEFLERTREEAIAAGASVPIHMKVLEGDPAESIDERIRKTAVELTVMTTHGRGRFERMWLGSVSDGLLRRAPCPILLWRPAPDDGEPVDEHSDVDLAARPTFRHIVTPLDGSRVSAAMVPEAVAMARTFGARLSFIRAVSDGIYFTSTYLPHAAREEREREKEIEEARAELERTAEEARREGVEADAEVVEEDDAASAILAYRRRTGADLIAMSTRGRGGVSRFVLGSVADKVIRAAHVPVLAHRHEDSGEAGER